jgi:hypothetical protein
VTPSDVVDGEREAPVSDPTPATSVATLAKALRTAQGDALPASTVTMLAQLTSDMARLTSMPALRTPVDAGLLAAVARVPMPRYELPEVTRLMNRIPAHLTGVDFGRSAALNAVLASVGPASSRSDIFAKLGVASGANAAVAAQLSQMLSQRNALAGVVATAAAHSASSAVNDAFAASGLSARNALVAAQAAQIVTAQDSIARLVATTNINASVAGLLDTLTRYSQVQTHLGAFAVDVEAPVMLRGYTRLAGRRYDSYLDSLPPRPIARRATVARFAGEAQTGLVVAEALTSDIDDDEREDLTERFDLVSIEAWQSGPAAAQQDLFTALSELDPSLPGWLKAAWENIERDGHKAASLIAHSTVECIDRTLRVLAPVDDVSAWIAEQGGPKPGWVGSNDRPTRRAKVMYAMRNRSKRDVQLANRQVEALVSLVQDLMDDFQSVKHAEATTIVVLRNWVLSTEAALSQLLLVP